MILELHMIQNFAPSNLNRDDTGAPKDAEFGGYRRARISSQALKRAMRTQFARGMIEPSNLATRTKRLVDVLSAELAARGRKHEDAGRVVVAALNAMPATVGSDRKTKYLLFVGRQEIDRLAGVCDRSWNVLVSALETASSKGTSKRRDEDGKGGTQTHLPKELQEELVACLDGGKAVDLGLFGRMIAELPARNVDAASQVAHAISTHRVSMEFDYYTAVDDLRKEDTAGAGMIGTVQFNSACFYRYANVDQTQLVKNLSGDREKVLEGIEAFIRAAVDAIPTGKQNSMAAHNPPSMVLAVVRDRGLWSLANAFARPVRADDENDLVVNSVRALDEYWEKMERMYGTGGIRTKAIALLDDVSLKALAGAKVDNLEMLIGRTLEALSVEGRSVGV